ncbi:MAG: hypothetical protein DMF94_25615 [Acidobacteria bacterium]|nr:MAG: hypothetical protein DMF94_25615 [Acidobacteriota bacterium]
MALVIAAMGGAGLVAQETRSATLLTTEHWLDWERGLYAADRQPARGQMGIVAVDPERGRIAAPVPGEGIGRALVA